MKQYEYKQLHDKPFITMTDPKQFAEWMLKTMNKWGSEGWMLVQISTPQINNQLTGDLMALGCREIQEKTPVQEMPDVVPTLRAVVKDNHNEGLESDLPGEHPYGR